MLTTAFSSGLINLAIFFHNGFLQIKNMFRKEKLSKEELDLGEYHPVANSSYRKFVLLIIVSTIPTGIIGIVGGDFFDSLYTSVIPIGVGLIITGFLLMFAERMGNSRRGLDKMNFRNAFFIGIVQGIAICPGISRSGSTLFGSLICNLERSFAVKFVFLISIPSILGSAVLEIPDALAQGLDPSLLGPVLAGMVVAAVSGLIAIKTMIKIVSNKKLNYFSWYVWIVGAAVILYGIFGA